MPSETHGYRGEMHGYMLNEDVQIARGRALNNPQISKGGLPQIFIPGAQNLIDNGILTPVTVIKLKK